MDSLKRKTFNYFYKAKKYLASFYFWFKGKRGNINTDKTNLDKKLIYSLSKSKIPTFRQIKHVKILLSKKEILIIHILAAIILINAAFVGIHFYKNNLQVVPVVGGEYVEGLIGTPSYINPLYSNSNDASRDIAKLIFSGLLKYDKNEKLVNDLASKYKVSEDQKKYSFIIREGVKWHDDSELTAEDIIFTFNAIKDPRYKSPLQASFVGVEIKQINDHAIDFVLTEPYAAFLDLLTFGILPQSYWLQIQPESSLLAELNTKPVGSGPYYFKSLIKDKAGKIKSYTLERFGKYYDKKPFVKLISFKFFPNFEEATSALNENLINGISYLPRHNKENLIAKDSLNIHSLNMARINAVFLNHTHNSSLEDKRTRQALALAINKNQIVSEVLEGEARIIYGPILPNNFAYNENIKKYHFNIVEAEKLLANAGWKKLKISEEIITKINNNENVDFSEEEKNKILSIGAGDWLNKKNTDDDKIKDIDFLTITLTTVNTNENIKIVNDIKDQWETIGVKTELNIIQANQIQSEIIKTKNFDAFFYGQIVGNDPDSYIFWHSSQIEQGLNISNYSNKEVDQLLEDARLTSDQVLRVKKYKKFQEILTEDVPAIFMYSPVYSYIQDKKIKNFDIKNILEPSDRFNNIFEWYIKTDKKILW